MTALRAVARALGRFLQQLPWPAARAVVTARPGRQAHPPRPTIRRPPPVAAFGGMSGLVKAAKAEGALNVITLPTNWCNYGAIINSFSKKYGIKITSENPEGSSQDEINAMVQLKGQSREPDVLDMGTPFAIKADQMHLLTPYTVSAPGATSPPRQRASDNTWWADYGGYVAIGYNSAVVKTPPTSFKYLLKPMYNHMVGINNSPTEAGAAFAAVLRRRPGQRGLVQQHWPGHQLLRQAQHRGQLRARDLRPVHGRRAGPRPSSSGGTTCRSRKSWPKSRPGRSSSPATGSTPPTTTRPYRPTPRTPPPPGCGRSTCTRTAGQNQWLQGFCRPIELSTMVARRDREPGRLQGAPSRPAGLQGLPDASPGHGGRERSRQGLGDQGHHYL